MARKRTATGPQWERHNAHTEHASIGVLTRRREKHERSDQRGFIHLAVTQGQEGWSFRAVYATLSNDAGEIAQGTACRQEHAKKLAEHAAELYLADRHGDGLYSVAA